MITIEELLDGYRDNTDEIEKRFAGDIFYGCVFNHMRNVPPTKLTITKNSFRNRKINALFNIVSKKGEVLTQTLSNLGIRKDKNNEALFLFSTMKECQDFYIEKIIESFNKHRMLFSKGYFPEKEVEGRSLLKKGLFQDAEEMEIIYNQRIYISGFSPLERIAAKSGTICKRDTKKVGPLVQIKAYTSRCESQEIENTNVMFFDNEDDARLFFNEEVFKHVLSVRKFVVSVGYYDPIKFTKYVSKI